VNGQTVRRATCCLCILWVGGCGRKQAFKLNEGRYALRMKGQASGKGKAAKALEDTDTFTITRNGEDVLMRMVRPELPAWTPPEVKRLADRPMKGRLKGDSFTCTHANPGMTNDFVGKLVADGRAKGTWTACRADGTLWAEGTWTLEPADD